MYYEFSHSDKDVVLKNKEYTTKTTSKQIIYLI